MVFSATFNNILFISWRSVLLVEEKGENLRSVASHWKTLSHNVVSNTPRHEDKGHVVLFLYLQVKINYNEDLTNDLKSV